MLSPTTPLISWHWRKAPQKKEEKGLKEEMHNKLLCLGLTFYNSLFCLVEMRGRKLWKWSQCRSPPQKVLYAYLHTSYQMGPSETGRKPCVRLTVQAWVSNSQWQYRIDKLINASVSYNLMWCIRDNQPVELGNGTGLIKKQHHTCRSFCFYVIPHSLYNISPR